MITKTTIERFMAIDEVMDVKWFELPAGARLAPFRAPWDAMIFTEQGRMKWSLGDKDYEGTPGKVLHSVKDITVRAKVMGQVECKFVVVHFSTWLKEAGIYPQQAAIEMKTGIAPQLFEMLLELQRRLETPDYVSPFRAKEWLHRLLQEVFESCRSKEDGSKANIAEDALSYIHRCYMEPMTLQELAARSGRNVNQFSYLFHKYTGFRPIDYLLRYRMKQADHLLRRTPASVKEVALRVGYSDLFYFSKLFKKHVGNPPSQIKQEFNNNTNEIQ
jgi:AraC-like DNA-binding protein